jgi:hypothetical protein
MTDIPVLVCGLKDEGPYPFTDNLEAPCAACGRTVVYRPNNDAPDPHTKLCIYCTKEVAEEERERGEGLSAAITQETYDEGRALGLPRHAAEAAAGSSAVGEPQASGRRAVMEVMPQEKMLGHMFKEYADLGHWFDTAHGQCIRCGTPTIDLYEDGMYGSIRRCEPKSEDLSDG